MQSTIAVVAAAIIIIIMTTTIITVIYKDWALWFVPIPGLVNWSFHLLNLFFLLGGNQTPSEEFSQFTS